ncbi:MULTISPECIES: hypothetical protein [Kitasatospora]|uniref:Uncharacterized protein n=2 Tax=Kitasatospora TaxID=2063 RepID=A0ABT1J225_9ACTN|nr:hypothetical protein [Kitasatospora paracochleata]MCP2311131.1 hypothetical protein [Kitasatospora paracochleata]
MTYQQLDAARATINERLREAEEYRLAVRAARGKNRLARRARQGLTSQNA